MLRQRFVSSWSAVLGGLTAPSQGCFGSCEMELLRLHKAAREM